MTPTDARTPILSKINPFFSLLRRVGIILSLLAAACTAAGPTPTVTPLPTQSPTVPATRTSTPVPPTGAATASATSTVASTSTPWPTQEPTTSPVPTVTPTPASYPTLSPQGPYMVFADDGEILIVDADGRGRKSIALLDDIWGQTLSPDGQWFAYIGGDLSISEPNPNDLALNLIHLPDGTVHLQTPLLSADFPDNFAAQCERLETERPDLLPEDADCLSVISMTFYGIGSLAWSPDSGSLAFAGEMDGPTSDVYLYDVEKQTTRRLTNDLLNVQNVEWSPDGKWILYENVVPGNIYFGSVLHAIRPDGSQTRELNTDGYWWWYGVGWLSPNLYIITTHGDGGDPSRLRVLDIETNQSTYLWEDIYFICAIDPEDELVAVVGARHDQAIRQLVDYGLYFISADGTSQKILETIGWVEFLGGEPPRFVGSSKQGSMLIGEDGSVLPLSEKAFVGLNASPDQRRFVLYRDAEDAPGKPVGADLYSADGQFVRTISDQNVTGVVWRPDSLGLFFRTGSGWYYVAMPDGQPVLLDEYLSNRDFLGFIWFP